MAEAGPPGAALTPPPSPRPEPWHPIHPARANPRPGTPSGSVPTRRPPLQDQVRARILAPAPAPSTTSRPATGPSEGGGPPHPLCGDAPCPQPQWRGRGVGRGGWRAAGSRARDAGLYREWVWVWVQQEVYLHTCQHGQCSDCLHVECVSGGGGGVDWPSCWRLGLCQAGPGCLPALGPLARTPDLSPPPWGAGARAHTLLPGVPGLGLHGMDRWSCAHSWSVL